MKIFVKAFAYLINKLPSAVLFKFYFKFFNKSNRGIIIALHRVISTSQHSSFNSFIEITSQKLEEVIINLKRLDVEFISLSELSSTFENSTNKQKPITHITFDDGYLDNLTYAFGLLKKHNIRFSIFITSDFIDNKEPFVWWYMVEHIINNEIEITFDKYHFTINEETYQRELKKEIFEMLRGFIIQTFEKDEEYLAQKLLNAIPGDNSLFVPKMLKWKQINELIASGLCEVGIHTKSHARFCNLNKAERVEQIMACKEEIFSRTGTVAKYFAYPYGSKTDIGETKDLKEIMESCGIELAFTTIADELNHTTDRTFVPRVFINNSTTMYSLKSRLNGSFQRSL